MNRKADFFQLKVEEGSTVKLQYLDIVVQRDGEHLNTFPYLKDPGLSRRLSRHSAHPHEVHKSWPKMLLKHADELTSSKDALCDYRKVLTDRLICNGCMVPSFDACGSHVRSRNFMPSSIFWFPVGFHPWWHRQVRRAITRWNRDTTTNQLLLMAVGTWRHPRVRIAWKNMLPSTQSLLQ